MQIWLAAENGREKPAHESLGPASLSSRHVYFSLTISLPLPCLSLICATARFLRPTERISHKRDPSTQKRQKQPVVWHYELVAWGGVNNRPENIRLLYVLFALLPALAQAWIGADRSGSVGGARRAPIRRQPGEEAGDSSGTSRRPRIGVDRFGPPWIAGRGRQRAMISASGLLYPPRAGFRRLRASKPAAGAFGGPGSAWIGPERPGSIGGCRKTSSEARDRRGSVRIALDRRAGPPQPDILAGPSAVFRQPWIGPDRPWTATRPQKAEEAEEAESSCRYGLHTAVLLSSKESHYKQSRTSAKCAIFSVSELLYVLLSTRTSGPFSVKCQRAPSRPVAKFGPKAQQLTDNA